MGHIKTMFYPALVCSPRVRGRSRLTVHERDRSTKINKPNCQGLHNRHDSRVSLQNRVLLKLLRKLYCIVCNVCRTLCIADVQRSIEQNGLSEQCVLWLLCQLWSQSCQWR